MAWRGEGGRGGRKGSLRIRRKRKLRVERRRLESSQRRSGCPLAESLVLLVLNLHLLVSVRVRTIERLSVSNEFVRKRGVVVDDGGGRKGDKLRSERWLIVKG